MKEAVIAFIVILVLFLALGSVLSGQEDILVPPAPVSTIDPTPSP